MNFKKSFLLGVSAIFCFQIVGVSSAFAGGSYTDVVNQDDDTVTEGTIDSSLPNQIDEGGADEGEGQRYSNEEDEKHETEDEKTGKETTVTKKGRWTMPWGPGREDGQSVENKACENLNKDLGLSCAKGSKYIYVYDEEATKKKKLEKNTYKKGKDGKKSGKPTSTDKEASNTKGDGDNTAFVFCMKIPCPSGKNGRNGPGKAIDESFFPYGGLAMVAPDDSPFGYAAIEFEGPVSCSVSYDGEESTVSVIADATDSKHEEQDLINSGEPADPFLPNEETFAPDPGVIEGDPRLTVQDGDFYHLGLEEDFLY